MIIDIYQYVAISIIMWILGISGIFINRKNILIIICAIELTLLSLNLMTLFFTVYIDNMVGEVYSLIILTIAAAESTIGLAILIVFYRLKGSIITTFISKLKG